VNQEFRIQSYAHRVQHDHCRECGGFHWDVLCTWSGLPFSMPD
jgi:hypothetical protein